MFGCAPVSPGPRGALHRPSRTRRAPRLPPCAVSRRRRPPAALVHLASCRLPEPPITRLDGPGAPATTAPPLRSRGGSGPSSPRRHRRAGARCPGDPSVGLGRVGWPSEAEPARAEKSRLNGPLPPTTPRERTPTPPPPQPARTSPSPRSPSAAFHWPGCRRRPAVQAPCSKPRSRRRHILVAALHQRQRRAAVGLHRGPAADPLGGQERPGAARSGQERPGAARSGQERPGGSLAHRAHPMSHCACFT